MSPCPAFSADTGGMAQALAAIDCRTGEATAYSFGRLFGADGALMPVLTLLLTLYVAFFAISLLTGRSRLGVGALTPRMLTLGLILTFATSWAAYQNTVWTLTTQGPDEIASLLAGTRGSATDAFAQRLDVVFNDISDAATDAARPAPPTQTGITPATPMVGGFTAATVLTLSAMMLLLGTVGVLVTSKIALAALLALGPVFIVLALFGGTRGLFEGWLKATVLFALVPLFSVLIGSGAVAALQPIVADVAAAGEQPEARAVAILFTGTIVYLALMLIVLKTASTIVLGWRLPGSREREAERDAKIAAAVSNAPPVITVAGNTTSGGGVRPMDDRIRGMVTAMSLNGGAGGGGAMIDPPRARIASAQVVPLLAHGSQTARDDGRLRGVGSRFRDKPAALRREKVS